MSILIILWFVLACAIWANAAYQMARFHREWWNEQKGQSFWFKFWRSNKAIFSETLSERCLNRRRKLIASAFGFIGALLTGCLLFGVRELIG